MCFLPAWEYARWVVFTFGRWVVNTGAPRWTMHIPRLRISRSAAHVEIRHSYTVNGTLSACPP